MKKKTTKKTRGRPRYAPTKRPGNAPNRNYRMVDEEYAKLKKAARKAGLTISDATREAVMEWVNKQLGE